MNKFEDNYIYIKIKIMYLRLNHTEKDGYIAEIVNLSLLNEEEKITPHNLNDHLQIKKISEVDYNLLTIVKSSIRLGITDNGFDTNSINEDEKEIMELRDVHPALYEFYLTKNGVKYRMYCSSLEKYTMINEYEEIQNLLELLNNSGFSNLDTDKYSSVYKRLSY
jgi:hypothetical protein